MRRQNGQWFESQSRNDSRSKEGRTKITLDLPAGRGATPVSLYKVGSTYFVLDGHHRISVARYQGVEWIDPDVTELHAEYRAIEGATTSR
jgi:hypothetical protein